jgi:hypothetical protein
LLSKSKKKGNKAFRPLKGIAGVIEVDFLVLSLVSPRAIKVIPFSAESLVKSFFSFSVKSWRILAISS